MQDKPCSVRGLPANCKVARQMGSMHATKGVHLPSIVAAILHLFGKSWAGPDMVRKCQDRPSWKAVIETLLQRT